MSLKRTLIVVFIANEVRDIHTHPSCIDRFAIERKLSLAGGVSDVRRIDLFHPTPPVYTIPTHTHTPTQENNSIAGIGVDGLMAAGALDQVKNGPLFWVRIAYCIYLIYIYI